MEHTGLGLPKSLSTKLFNPKRQMRKSRQCNYVSERGLRKLYHVRMARGNRRSHFAKVFVETKVYVIILVVSM